MHGCGFDCCFVVVPSDAVVVPVVAVVAATEETAAVMLLEGVEQAVTASPVTASPATADSERPEKKFKNPLLFAFSFFHWGHSKVVL